MKRSLHCTLFPQTSSESSQRRTLNNKTPPNGILKDVDAPDRAKAIPSFETEAEYNGA